jgi:hypothetical protein
MNSEDRRMKLPKDVWFRHGIRLDVDCGTHDGMLTRRQAMPGDDHVPRVLWEQLKRHLIGPRLKADEILTVRLLKHAVDDVRVVYGAEDYFVGIRLRLFGIWVQSQGLIYP